MRTLLALVSLSLASGCAVITEPDDAEADESAVTVSQHSARVRRCASTISEAASEAERDAAAEREGKCIVRANDATIEQIEGKLSRAASAWRGKAKAAFAGERAAAAALCASVDKGRATFTASKPRCIRDGEKLVAALIDAHVDLGGARISISEADARAAHTQCYGRFDAQLALGASEAARELVRCVERNFTVQGEILALLNAPPGADPDRIQDRVNGEVATVIRTGSDLCSVLTDSGSGALATCLTEVRHGFYTILRDAQPRVGQL